MKDRATIQDEEEGVDYTVTPSFTAGGPIIRHYNTNRKDLCLCRVASADSAGW